jgi:two-component system cell cycle response regulator
MPVRVLVVEDTPLNVKLLTLQLEYQDYIVNTAANGLEALAKIEADKPDIVLLDVMMPGLDGFETCRRIRANPATAHIPVVMVTALQDVDDLVRGFEPAPTISSSPYRSTALRLSLASVRSYSRNVSPEHLDPPDHFRSLNRTLADLAGK